MRKLDSASIIEARNKKRKLREEEGELFSISAIKNGMMDKVSEQEEAVCSVNAIKNNLMDDSTATDADESFEDHGRALPQTCRML